MTVFIGIAMPNTVSETLFPFGTQIAAELGGKPTRPCNFHLTLRFLGEVGDLAPLIHAMEETARQFKSTFDLVLYGIGRFQKKNREIYWAGIRDSASLKLLRHILEKQLAEIGYMAVETEFCPHITLCRNARIGVTSVTEIPPLTVTVDRITLFSSEHTDDGVFYRILDEKEFCI